MCGPRKRGYYKLELALVLEVSMQEAGVQACRRMAKLHGRQVVQEGTKYSPMSVIEPSCMQGLGNSHVDLFAI